MTVVIANSFGQLKRGSRRRVVVLMDNAPIHFSAEFVVDNHQIRNLPPYGPMIDSIENGFSSLKVPVKQIVNEINKHSKSALSLYCNKKHGE